MNGHPRSLNVAGLVSGSIARNSRLKQHVPVYTANQNVSAGYSSTAMEVFKSSLENSGQDAISKTLNETNISLHKSGDHEEEDSESAVAEEDLVCGESGGVEIVKEEVEGTDWTPDSLEESEEECI